MIAILFMVQGHALDVLLAPAHRQGPVFESWLFLRGLTAPMFFTLSGISFTLSSLKYWQEYARLSSRVVRRVRRFAFFVFLGYLMHLPVKSFHDFRWLDSAGWQGWLQVDVLQCVGCTLLFLQLLLWLAKTPRKFAVWSASLGVLVVLATPISYSIGWIHLLPLSAAGYLTSQTGSLFPMLPWSGYLLCGSALGYLISRHIRGQNEGQNRDQVSLAFAPFCAGGAALVLAGLCVALLPFHPYGAIYFWTISPGVFLLKSGSVILMLTLLSQVMQYLPMPRRETQAIAEESLTIYFIHVCILYGSIWHDGLRQMVGPSLDVAPTIVWIAVLLGSVLFMARFWNWYKKNQQMGGWLVRSTAFALVIAYGLK